MTQHVEYKWVPEGDGFTLYRFVNGVRGRNCGRLNTDAVGSTHDLATLYNSAPELLRQRNALREALQRLILDGDFYHPDDVNSDGMKQARAVLALCDKTQP